MEPSETSEPLSVNPHSKFKFYDPKLLRDCKKGDKDV